ncbi:hypothetical protein [Roseicyclus elongatus]|uniref:hypothetical protein n=1 Tax=Roseicyclus elongatus TaxID=159346 RepID=UPI0012EC52B7|nr:hypothetical protein [Roseibacterium elongatum]
MDFWTLFSIADVVGISVSIFGAGATVFFSIRAKTSADAARVAAMAAREKYSGVTVLSSLNIAVTLLNDLTNRLSSGSWELAEERSTALRTMIAPIAINQRELFSDQTHRKLLEFISKMKSVAEASDRAQFTNSSQPSRPRLLGIVREEKQTLAIAIDEVKERLAADEQ